MKLTSTIVALLTLVSTGAFAGDIQSIDIVLDSLHYQTPKGGEGEAGDLRFRSLDFYSSDIFLNLYDEGTVFDSTLHVRKDFLGIRGKNHALGIKMDASALQAIRDLRLGQSAIGFNEKRINFDSQELVMDHQAVDLDMKNFTFDCKKHPNYPGNDVEALKYGCLSNSTFKGLEENSAVELTATLKNIDEQGKEATISSTINKVEFKTERILMDAKHASVDMGKELQVQAQNVKLTCNKSGNLSKFDPNRLMLDCIDDVSFTVSNVAVNAEIEGETGTSEMMIKSTNPAVILDKKEVRVKAEKVEINGDGMGVTGRNIHLSCEKNNENISNKDIGALIATCLDTSRIREMNGSLADFTIDLENETIGKVNISTRLSSLDMDKGQFKTEVGFTKVNLNDQIMLGSHQMKVACDAHLAIPKHAKEIKLEDVKLDESMEYCMNSISIPKAGIFLANADRAGRYFVDANNITVSKNLVTADLAGVQLVNEKGSTTLFNLKGSCKKNSAVQATDYKAMIGECIQQGNFVIGSMVGDEENERVSNIFKVYDQVETLQGRGLNPTRLVSTFAPDMKNLTIDAKGGYVTVKVQTKVLGAYRNAVLAGNATFDVNSEKLILDVKQADLPFGISGVKLSLMIIKTIIADDRIAVDSSGKKIVINLKY